VVTTISMQNDKILGFRLSCVYSAHKLKGQMAHLSMVPLESFEKEVRTSVLVGCGAALRSHSSMLVSFHIFCLCHFYFLKSLPTVHHENECVNACQRT